MKNIYLIIIVFFIGHQFSISQENDLIPLDSCEYIMIADKLVSLKADFISDSSRIENLNRLRNCPCARKTENGIMSFETSSFKIEENKCFFIYRDSIEYKIRVGKMIGENNNFEYNYKLHSIDSITFAEISQTIFKKIQSARIPTYQSMLEIPIVHDANQYIFGNHQDKKFGIVNVSNDSKEISNLITRSEKLINKYYKKK
jgi:hypothetical protein